jgi:hypothetical protein
MTNNPNYTIKDTNSAKVQMKLRGFGQQRLKEQNTLSPPAPNIPKLHISVLESRQKSIQQTPSENTQNTDVITYITTTILYYTTKTYNKLATSRKYLQSCALLV